MIRWSPTVVVLLALTGGAAAQIRPKVMIIFDTSGSMLRTSTPGKYGGPCLSPGNTCDAGLTCFNIGLGWLECRLPNGSLGDDGSALCPGTGSSTRIYQLKTALFEVLQGMGAQEFDFALSTYPMMVDPTRTPECPLTCVHPNGLNCAGHYYVDPAQDWEFPAAPSIGMFHGCKVSTHTPTAQQNATCSDPSDPCTAWYASYKKEVLKVPFGHQPEEVLYYFDQQEDPTALPPGQPLQNPEVRASFNWYTPLGKSLFYAYGYLDKEVSLPPGDYLKKCERLMVAFFTDGEETCNTDSSDPFRPQLWASNLAAPIAAGKSFTAQTHLVAIDVSSSNPTQCSQTLQDIATAGQGSCYPVQGTTASLKAAFLNILAKAQPPQESCNGEDDDCDGKIDEDFPLKGQPCTNGKLGVCYKTGLYVCKADGTGLVCDAPDASGTTEKCNNLDDDCDGQIDEELPDCFPYCQPEVCNGLDDDCDGTPDNNIPSVPCGKDVGECKPGMTECVGGQLLCAGGSQPKAEVCNGLDDDCDTQRDGMSEPCYSFATGCVLQSGICKGICKLGNRLCTAVQAGGVWSGEWGSCVGEVGPAAEICDGIDNNCDGDVDEQAECPGGSVCINGACSSACGSNEFACPAGQICTNGWCVPDPCDAAACDAKGGWICKGGECIDPCANVSCDPLEICRKGACVDTSCYATGCPPGERCLQGRCAPDPCHGVDCGSDGFCHAGACLRLCEFVPCQPGEVCRVVETASGKESRCVEDPCHQIVCPRYEVCLAGKCLSDPCASVHCPRGQLCVEGACIGNPCEVTACPRGYACRLGECVLPNVVSTTEMLASGSGGCACTITETEGGEMPLYLVLVLAILAWTRRTRRG